MKEALDIEIKILVSDSQYNIIKDLAELDWSSVSSYVRSLIAKDFQINYDKLSPKYPKQISLDLVDKRAV